MPEPYLEILDLRNTIILCKFRITNHRLLVKLEEGKYDTNNNWR